ncbi:MAG TPA: urate oxidase [Terriglobia bacterium]|nr:urate oxidase [Terriglobia bacterium]
MPVKLAENEYGKSRVRLVKVERHGSRHELQDLSFDIQLSGDFTAAYAEGKNELVLPTDTMKNTVYALARQQPLGEIEEFGERLTGHFLSRNPQVERVRVAISQNSWARIKAGTREHDYAFVRAGEERRTSVVEQARSGQPGPAVRSGIADLAVLKTSRSAFQGFLRDEYTTLEDTPDRLLSTAVTAEWTCAPGVRRYGEMWRAARQTILEVFANHDSRGVQHTLYAIGSAVLERVPEIARIELALPNRHCYRVDLAPFGLDNPNEVFAPADEPYGLIRAVLARS